VQDHWYLTTTAFTVIIHIIIYKLMLETVFWNAVSVTMCLLCMTLYYLMVLGLCFHPISTVFQNQLDGELQRMLRGDSPNFWILLIVLPFFALVPDITINLFERVIYPTPADLYMRKQKEGGP
jgi:Phospholipid-translocating P-type ATPase C-terminal